MNSVLITGAAGDVGSRLRKLMKGSYPRIRWSDIRRPDDLAADDEFVLADLGDPSAVSGLVQGMDGIVHLGGFTIDGEWDRILKVNIDGLFHLFDAAHRAGVKRVVFASSNHAVGFYPRAQRIGVDVTVRPDSRYGLAKAFGEALGALYADKHGLRVTCVRIGNVNDRPIDKRRLSIWLSPDDLVQLIRIGLEHPGIHYEIFYGVSDNVQSWYDNSNALRFGYRPMGKAEDYREEALLADSASPIDPIAERFQGGSFASFEYDADQRRD
jgi:uronate dehydrogenase